MSRNAEHAEFILYDVIPTKKIILRIFAVLFTNNIIIITSCRRKPSAGKQYKYLLSIILSIFIFI